VKGLVAAGLLTCSVSFGAEIRFSGEELAGFIQHAFSDTRIRLHQDGGAPGTLSYIDLGSNFGEQRFSFSVPPKDIALGIAGHARYVLNDIHSVKPIEVAATKDAFVISLRFEDEGTELRGVPLGRLRRFRAGAIPDVDISEIRMEITIVPESPSQEGEVRFRSSRVSFLGNTQAGGLGNVRIFGRQFDLLDPLTDYKRTLRNAIERDVKKLIDRNLPRLAEQVSTEIRRRGAAMGMQIHSVRFDATDLVITGAVTLR
jgi:hypothetical protein